jgi:hypothetical protein
VQHPLSTGQGYSGYIDSALTIAEEGDKRSGHANLRMAVQRSEHANGDNIVTASIAVSD